MSSVAKSVLVSVLWFLAGGALGGMTAMLMGIGALGGMHTPPAWWWTVVMFGAFGLPFILAFGWIPTVVAIMREKPALKTALISLAVCGGTWLATMIAWETGRPKV